MKQYLILSLCLKTHYSLQNTKGYTDPNGTYLRQITSRLRLLVIPAQAGIQGTKPPTVQMDPGLRRDDGGFGLSKCHSIQTLVTG